LTPYGFILCDRRTDGQPGLLKQYRAVHAMRADARATKSAINALKNCSGI